MDTKGICFIFEHILYNIGLYLAAFLPIEFYFSYRLRQVMDTCYKRESIQNKNVPTDFKGHIRYLV